MYLAVANFFYALGLALALGVLPIALVLKLFIRFSR